MLSVMKTLTVILLFTSCAMATDNTKKCSASTCEDAKESSTAKAVAIGTGAATAYGIAPTVVSAIGFTAKGIAAKSTGAAMMSVLGGATTQAGGLVATLQAVGATSTVFVSAPAIIATGGIGAIAGGIAYLLFA